MSMAIPMIFGFNLYHDYHDSRSDRSGRPQTRETSTAGFNLYSDHGIWKIEGVGFRIIYSEEKLLKNINLCPSQIHQKQCEETTGGDVSQVPWILLSEIISKKYKEGLLIILLLSYR